MRSMIKEILDCVTERGSCSFNDLSKIEGFTGPHFWGHTDMNLYFWLNCSEDAVQALGKLHNDKMIILNPITNHDEVLLSHLNHYPAYPICFDGEPKDSPHWIPVYLELAK